MRKYLEILALIVPLGMVLFAMAGGGLADAAWLGMKVASLNKGAAAQMGVPLNAGQVVVVAVEGPALSSGVIVGDLVIGVNGRKILTVNDFLQAARFVMTSRGPDGLLPDVVLTINRLGRPLVLTIPSEWVEASIRVKKAR